MSKKKKKGVTRSLRYLYIVSLVAIRLRGMNGIRKIKQKNKIEEMQSEKQLRGDLKDLGSSIVGVIIEAGTYVRHLQSPKRK